MLRPHDDDRSASLSGNDRMSDMLPRTIQIAVDTLAASGRAMEWPEFAVVNGWNAFRLIKARGLVRNIVPGYKPGEAYTGPRMPCYVLTDKGKSFVSAAASETSP